MIFDEVTRLARAQLALARIDAGKGDADIRVRGRNFRNLVIGHAPRAEAALAVDREQAEGDLLLAINFDYFRDLRPFARGLEIGAGSIEKPAHHRIFGIVA